MSGQVDTLKFLVTVMDKSFITTVSVRAPLWSHSVCSALQPLTRLWRVWLSDRRRTLSSPQR